MPQVEADNWYGLVVAAATPETVVAKLRAAASRRTALGRGEGQVSEPGAIAVGNSSEEFAAYVKSETTAGARSSPRRDQDQVGKVVENRLSNPCG
jgi:tripartite-type tricarboxylate transporter receptor subunit TctC